MNEEFLFCKHCRTPKMTNRGYCWKCIGKHQLGLTPYRIRMFYSLLPNNWKEWFLYHLSLDQDTFLLPEHLKYADWVDIDELNNPTGVE